MGAQAFNNVDTYLAPFIYMDKLRHEEKFGPISDELIYSEIVKQSVQSFLHNLNTTSRWGGQCVPDTYECLTPDGWKTHSELNVGDEIYVYDIETGVVKRDNLTRVNHFKYKGNMVKFSNRKLDFLNTEEHRVVREVHGSRKSSSENKRKFVVNRAKDLIGKAPVNIPLLGQSVDVESMELDNSKIPLLAWPISDTHMKKDNDTDNLTAYENNVATMKATLVEDWKGHVWCPTTNTGTFICRNPQKPVPFITGNSPFTNVTLDVICPDHMKDEAIIYGGKIHDSLTYGDFQKYMDMFNKAFLEVMLEGDSGGRIFAFPIPTYNITKDFPWDSEIGELVLKVTGKYGVPYFQNFINSELKPSDIRSMCCRLSLSLSEIQNVTGGLFGAGDSTGSINVTTLNLPKLGYISKDREEFFTNIRKYCELAKELSMIKRNLLEKNLKNGFYPWTKRYLNNGYKKHFSTIGLCGGHEACMNLLSKGIDTEEGTELMKDTLLYLREIVSEFQVETGTLFNLEATPAEGCSYRLARVDKKMYGDDIYQSGDSTPYYTNSTMLPVNKTTNPFEALEHQDKLQPLYSGGTVFHTFLGEAIPDTQALKSYLLKAMTNTKLPYISITPTFSICETHGYITGEHFECPTCNKECEVYSRIVGYLRPVSRWNKGKKEEYKNRKLYQLDT